MEHLLHKEISSHKYTLTS
uniref:Uncharacterized protein n=1 Tax=Arundo donax TaxID=35708 RepID=A0A0A9B1K1_ARUDO